MNGRILIVLFHKEQDDRAGKLNPLLQQRNALPTPQNRVCSVNFPDGLLIVCYDDSPTENDISEIKRLMGQTQFDRRKILIHKHTSSTIRAKQRKLSYSGQILENAEVYKYIHEEGDDRYDGLIKMLSKSKLIEFLSYIEKHREAKLRKSLTLLLHHRIAHLFLPMDIDVMGIFEVWKDKDKYIAMKYLREVLEGKSETYYREKLAKLQYMIAGKNIIFNGCNGNLEIKNGKIIKCNPVKCGDSEVLTEGKSIYDLILELEEKKKNEILDSDEWKNLLKHCGLKPQEISFIPEDSPILQFMCLMDSKIKNISDVEDILNFNPKEEPLNENELWFHKWFCELDKYLNQLKDKIGQ